jgi:Fic family protein
MHEILLDNVRGQNKDRGNFRRIQNWIGSPGSTMKRRVMFRQLPQMLCLHLIILKKYIHHIEKDRLVQLAIIHAQFEMIHPFLDGNGRIGRLLIPLFLYEKKSLCKPLF